MKDAISKPSELAPELLERAKAGDREALSALYETTELEIYRTVHAILRDEDLCRDVEQDAYLRAFSRLDELRDPAAFLPWLRQIAVNEARMQLRRKRPLLFSELDHDPEAGDPELPDDSPEASPELSLERKENARLVREILDGLSDGQRLLLGMFYYEQIPIKQIAADTGLSEGTVKTQLHRGRKRVEAAVKRLEEQGVKLYSLPPLPFLLALLKHQTPAAGAGKALMTETFAKAGKALMTETFAKAGLTPAAGTSSAAGVSSASAVSASTAAGSAAATAETAVYVGRTFFQTALGRVVLGVIAAGVVAGGAAGWRWARDNHVFGDYRPPTETLDILLHHDSDEDLPTEHTLETETPTTVPDTAEDLVPENNEDQTPETTDPVETTDSTAPTAPADPAPQPTDPTEPDGHSGEATVPSETAQPETEPIPSSAEEAAPRVVFFQADAGGDSDLIYDLPWGSATFVKVIVENGEKAEAPQVTTDNPDILRLTPPEGPVPVATGYVNAIIYTWYCELLQSGTAHVYCSLNGEAVGEITFVTPEYPDEFLSAEVRQAGMHMTEDLAYCYTDTYIAIETVFQGRPTPELSTDNPDVFQIYRREEYGSPAVSHWSQTGWFWDGRIVGPGDARLYLKLNGEIVHTWTVHAVDWDTEEDGEDDIVETGP